MKNSLPFIHRCFLFSLCAFITIQALAQGSDSTSYAGITGPPTEEAMHIKALTYGNPLGHPPEQYEDKMLPNLYAANTIKKASRVMALKYHTSARSIEEYWFSIYTNQYQIGIPAPVLMAIALNESWFKSNLFHKTGNPFGIKASGAWKGPTYTIIRNGRAIRYCVYGSADEATLEFGKFVRSRWWYADALACPFDDFKCFIDGLKSELAEPGFAMDPCWDKKIWRLIKDNDLENLCRR